jgi:Zn ribbon nucleic-acid-binding protein
MRAGTCPSCGSTDVFEMPKDDKKGHNCGCLDCPFTWRNGGRKKRRSL